MPRQYKARRFLRRKRTKKRSRSAIWRARMRRRSNRGQTRLLRGPVNTTAVAKLNYCDSISLTPVAGGLSTWKFRANSLYDPDLTATGHQPMGFDNLMANYQHFTVIGAKITVDFVGDAEDYLAAVHLNGSSTANYSNAQEIKERTRTVYKYVACKAETAGRCTLRHSFSAKKFFHVKAIVGESQYKGTESGNPTEEAYWYVTAAADNGAATIGTVKGSVRIEYIAVFSEPKSIGQS